MSASERSLGIGKMLERSFREASENGRGIDETAFLCLDNLTNLMQDIYNSSEIEFVKRLRDQAANSSLFRKSELSEIQNLSDLYIMLNDKVRSGVREFPWVAPTPIMSKRLSRNDSGAKLQGLWQGVKTSFKKISSSPGTYRKRQQSVRKRTPKRKSKSIRRKVKSGRRRS